jgi:Fe-S oxidoreductase
MSDVKTENLDKIRKALNVCTMCGFCKSVCPSYKEIGWDTASSRGRVTMAYGLVNGDLPADESVIRNMYTCTTCADCVRRCPSKVDVVDIVETARADLVKNGHMLPKHKAMTDSIVKYGNPYREEKSVEETLGVKRHKAEVGYFAGCTATYRSIKTSESTMSVLKKLGIDFTVVDEVCCGSVMQRVGYDNEYTETLFRKNVDAIKKLGVKTLVLSCAGCYRMFKTEYPKYVDVPFEVLHITEFLAKQDLNLKPLNATATYHDPCHLGRHCGVYEEPRQVIAKIPGLDFREMKYNRSLSHCCGGGGGVRSAFPEESLGISATRLDEAEGIDMIITTCPFCVSNLSAGKGDRNVEIVDLIELVDRLMP